jgi:hypothetical protein
MLTATPTKLRDGRWGARVVGSPRVGEEIEVRSASGKVWRAYVERLVWSGNGVALVATRSADGGPPRVRGRRRYEDDDACDLCGRNKYTCGHCIGW